MTKPMEFYVAEVSPQQAQAFLEKNTDLNRPLSPTTVERYARDMTEGRWKLTHEAIAFNRQGRLIDGQHRLAGIVKSGRTVSVMIADNCDPETFDAIGCGKPRSPSDIFVISYQRKYGTKPTYHVTTTSVASAMLRRFHQASSTREQIAEHALKHAHLIVAFAQPMQKVSESFSCTLVATFVNAALYYGRAKVEPLVDRFCAQAWTGERDPLKQLYQRLVRAKMAKRMDSNTARNARLDSPADIYSLGVCAIRAALDGRSIEKLMGTSNDYGEDTNDSRIRRGSVES